MRNISAIRFVLYYTMGINLLVTLAKLAVGYWTGSLSLIADGFDSVFDSASNVVGLVGIYIASRPADSGHPYGHRKFETLSAVSISVLLFVTTIELVQSAIERLRHPTTPEVNVWTFAALLFSVAAHLYVSVYEQRRGKELKSEFLIADALHTRADVLVSLSVMVGMIVVRLGYPIVDAILALVIALLIAKIGIDIIRDSSKVLADAAAVDVAVVQRIAGGVPGVQALHQVRSRGQEDDIHLDLHVQVEPGMPVEQAHHIAHQVQRRLRAEIEGVRDVVVHIEPEEGAAPQGALLDERIREIAGRLPGASVHDIQAYSLVGSLYISLHLEVERSLSMDQAHGLASQLEDMLRNELPDVRDVDVHIEPANHNDAQAVPADDATHRRVRAAIDEAIAAVGGLGRCYDLLVFRNEGSLRASAHCAVDGELTVDQAHALSRQVEHHVREHMPEVSQVTVHLEPRAKAAP